MFTRSLEYILCKDGGEDLDCFVMFTRSLANIPRNDGGEDGREGMDCFVLAVASPCKDGEER